MEKIKIGILIFEGVEPLDFVGPFEVFIRANNLNTEESLFDVSLIGSTLDSIICFGGMKVLPNRTFFDSEKYDYIVVPGGPGARQQTSESEIIKFIQSQIDLIEGVLTVCTGTYLIALTDLFNDCKMVTHHQRYNDFKRRFPQIDLVENYKYYEDQKLISSGGITSGIDGALYLVYKLFGEEIAHNTAKLLEYQFLI
jgi:transcriptional regulator GlxA family with amidase domain